MHLILSTSSGFKYTILLGGDGAGLLIVRRVCSSLCHISESESISIRLLCHTDRGSQPNILQISFTWKKGSKIIRQEKGRCFLALYLWRLFIFYLELDFKEIWFFYSQISAGNEKTLTYKCLGLMQWNSLWNLSVLPFCHLFMIISNINLFNITYFF